MAADSISAIRSRIDLQIARIETRAARLRPVDVGARLAAVRALAMRAEPRAS